jgi:hypothetical protein
MFMITKELGEVLPKENGSYWIDYEEADWPLVLFFLLLKC